MARCPQFEHSDRPMKALRAEDQGDTSLLLDDILIRIISRLPIRDAVVTGGVSKRWRDLWKYVPGLNLAPHHINLKDEGPRSKRAAWYAGVVRSVLCHHRGVGVNNFLFALPLASCCHNTELDRVMEFAAAARTRNFGFSLTNNYCSKHAAPLFDFPHWRFAGGDLQNLMLANVGLTVAPQRNLEGLAQLKYLYLTRVTVDDSSVADILSTCGSLTSLYLQECQQLVHVKISHARLHVLDIDRCGHLKSITIQSSTLTYLVYKGHKVSIKYSHTPAIMKLRILFCMENECPLDCVGSAGALPNLKQLFLEFPSPLHAATCTQLQGVQHKFGGLNQIVLLLKTPRKGHISSVAYLLVATPSVKELRVEAYNNLPTSPPDSLMIQWPERCLLKKLQSIIIGGFSGEPELMELTLFLLQRSPALRTLAIDTHRRHLHLGDRGKSKDVKEEVEDHVRCYYARGVAWTNLVPKIPSTVKFTIL